MARLQGTGHLGQPFGFGCTKYLKWMGMGGTMADKCITPYSKNCSLASILHQTKFHQPSLCDNHHYHVLGILARSRLDLDILRSVVQELLDIHKHHGMKQ